jgi:hypothetical protein
MLARIFGVEADAEPGPAPVENGSGYTHGHTTWSLPKMKRYVEALKPNGRQVLRAIVDLGPGPVTVDKVQAKVGLTKAHYAGAMSTFGFAARNMRGVHERPFTLSGRTYYIAPLIAALADEALKDLGV